ncbi:uncharacterized protein CEXT_590021 [Caerostris extrusa]|uniref:Chitin-binding type-2 domain-containing protein n=1 Tax=Caerostris extrusa TaxID=172846 RepID=A0AAV4WKY5_CAEEX|nr:uncharacterized protein CEXT_590021 [Caerostris extrusa]
MEYNFSLCYVADICAVLFLILLAGAESSRNQNKNNGNHGNHGNRGNNGNNGRNGRNGKNENNGNNGRNENNGKNENNGNNEKSLWPWGNKDKFVCPSSFGAFADITDCSQFYICVGGIANRKRCRRGQQFDKYRKVCLPFIIAVCDKGDDATTTDATSTTKKKDKDNFSCPSIAGSYMHPTDCSKYYSCLFFIPSLTSCDEGKLFDGVKKKCRPADEVNCGTRQRPDETTPEITTIITTTETEIEETTTPTEPETPSPTEPETTPTEPETQPPTEPETTTVTDEPTTTPKPRVTAPETDCDEDDVDCIIDDLGETPDWFVCPDDIGSYPHPSSKKLFIFCLNWKPSVKKCGQDLIFSEELLTCVHP